MTTLVAVDILANWVARIWIITGIVGIVGAAMRAEGTLVRVATAVCVELRPFYLPAVAYIHAYDLVLADNGNPAWTGFVLLCHLACWVAYKGVGNDDDRWKRRRRRLVEKVSRLGSRLVVAPGPAGA